MEKRVVSTSEWHDVPCVGSVHRDTVAWDDAKSLKSEQPLVRIVRLTIFSGSFVNGVGTTWMARGSNQQTSSLWFGNHGNFTKHEVDLHTGEHITSVSLRHGAIVDQLSFETSFGRQFTFGGSGGSPFQLDIPEGHRVVAFKGGFGGHIHSIGAVTTPLRPCGDASSWNTALHAVHFDKDFRAIVKTLFIMRTTTVTDETQQLVPKYKDSQWWMLPLEVFEMIVYFLSTNYPPLY